MVLEFLSLEDSVNDILFPILLSVIVFTENVVCLNSVLRHNLDDLIHGIVVYGGYGRQ